MKEINNTAIAEIIVAGYTDSIGTSEVNKNLSLARATAVKNFLKQKLSAKAYKIEALGFGESNPLFSNDTKEGQEKNRRVEIILMPAKK